LYSAFRQTCPFQRITAEFIDLISRINWADCIGPIRGLTVQIMQNSGYALASFGNEPDSGGLTPVQLWAKPFGFGSAGFHLLHIAGSTVRLMSYLQGRELTREQFAALAAEEKAAEEKTEGIAAAELLARMDRVFAAAEAAVRAIDPAILCEPRWVGRKRLPTTVAGLLTHIAEHIQRHIGQAISAAKLVNAMGPQS
jgi:uncharacterized damage-inducible protein DinB